MKLQDNPLLTMPHHLPGGSYSNGDLLPNSPADGTVIGIQREGDELNVKLKVTGENEQVVYIRIRGSITNEGRELLKKVEQMIRDRIVGKTYEILLNTEL